MYHDTSMSIVNMITDNILQLLLNIFTLYMHSWLFGSDS
jgi:hypothetical protein